MYFRGVKSICNVTCSSICDQITRAMVVGGIGFGITASVLKFNIPRIFAKSRTRERERVRANSL